MTLEELLAQIKEGKVDKGTDMASIIQAAIEANTSTVAGLKAKNSTLIGSNKDLKKSVDNMPEGFDKELWDTLLTEHNDKEGDKLKAEGKWNELKEQLETQHTKAVDQLNTEKDVLRSALSTQLVDNAAMEAITKAGGNAALLLPHIKASLKMTQGDDGAFSAIVADSKGEQMYSKVKAGESMGIEELVNEFKANDQYSAAFVSQNKGGGAGSGGSDKFNGKNPFAKESLNYTEQAKMMKSDPSLATQMKSAAQG